jgi:nucleotide-binding universal stress UspA family protein
MELRRVVVGVDGSANARRAVEWAGGLAKLLGAQVVAVYARGLLTQDDDGKLIPAQSARPDPQERLQEEWTEALVALSVDHECLVRDGCAVAVILDTAREVGADLIVLGSRGLGGYPELLLGSTSTQVAQRSSIPVVIVPDDHTAA